MTTFLLLRAGAPNAKFNNSEWTKDGFHIFQRDNVRWIQGLFSTQTDGFHLIMPIPSNRAR